MNKKILITASFLGVLSIVLGAFGAHGLKKIVTIEALQSFEIGVKYQMYHAFLLLFLGITNIISQKTKTIIYYFTIIGVLFFSGSIYGLSTNELSAFNFKSIAFITPIGGLFLIIAWVLLSVSFFKIKKD